MVKFQRIVFSVFLCVAGAVWFANNSQAAGEPDAVRFVSNRIKIVRPPKAVTPTATVLPAPAEKEIAAIAETKTTSPETAGPALMGTESPVGVEPVGQKSEAAIREEVAALIGKKEQFYTRKGRIDPFEPFLRKPEPEEVSEEDRLLERRVPRTPLEKIDLSQLRLTGVLRTLSKTKALVQDSSGKGYVIDEGTYVGNKGGQVARILNDRVVVEEKYLDLFGKIAVRERELKLQP